MKVGDKVRVRRFKDLLCAAPKADKNSTELSTDNLYFNPKMKAFCGMPYTIFKLDEDSDEIFLSSDEDFQDVITTRYRYSSLVNREIIHWTWSKEWIERRCDDDG